MTSDFVLLFAVFGYMFRVFNVFLFLEQDEKELQKLAKKQFRVLRATTEFRYGYKLVVCS